MRVSEKFKGVYLIEGKLATKNLAPGKKVYDEKLVKRGREEYRLWNPYRSKPAAALLKGMKNFPIKKADRVLYLGAASGTTASHISDIVGAKGAVFCVEFAPRAMRDLLPVCESRKNMLPILADARKPENYAEIAAGCDVLYQDVAQPDQAEIALRNAALLKKGGWALIAVKSQSIDAAREPKEIYEETLKKLSAGFEVIEKIELEPFDKDHLFIVAKKLV